MGTGAEGKPEARMLGIGVRDGEATEEGVSEAQVAVGDAEMREKARQMLGQQRRMAIAAVAVA